MIYSCSHENNTCIKKDVCNRYATINEECQATLFKSVCTEENDYILFIKTINEQEEINI